MTVRIVSYNLLVPIYAEQTDVYAKCKHKFLKTNYRWKLIEQQLEQEIIHHKNTIICLQELGLPMLPALELFFKRLNYSFFNNLYGNRWNDFMGVGIAVPISMQTNSISYTKIGDHIRSMCKRHEKTKGLFTWGWDLYQYALSKFIQSPSDPWNSAMSRSNTLICLQLVIDGKILYVGTYHMPCAYKEPPVMAIHSSIVKDLMYQIASGENFILAGDFNIKPNDTSYRILTEKNYDSIEFPTSNNYNITYQPKIEQVLKSAYREKNGSEPNYTNFADTTRSSYFCETLDYIFFVGQMTVKNVLSLPDRPNSESYPDATHPSDHLMIAATFQL